MTDFYSRFDGEKSNRQKRLSRELVTLGFYFMAYISYLLYRSLAGVLSRAPFSLLYGISDLLSWSLFHVIRYRRRLVFDQLRKCFPDWPDRKIYEVARVSYTNLSDILLESFKTVRLTEEEIKKRYKVMNSNILKSVEADKGAIIGIGSHMNNWEWGSVALEYQLPTKLYALYKPLANKYID
ncbi:MAG: hypothetical protein R3275_02895, partial [Saprospiraceae bacterium]|nr:hypothetical protein [Saprospiraceae bacterium]